MRLDAANRLCTGASTVLLFGFSSCLGRGVFVDRGSRPRSWDLGLGCRRGGSCCYGPDAGEEDLILAKQRNGPRTKDFRRGKHPPHGQLPRPRAVLIASSASRTSAPLRRAERIASCFAPDHVRGC